MVKVELSWDYNPKKGVFDVDLAALLFDKDGKLTPDECVYYAKPKLKGIELAKDSQTGIGGGPDEELHIDPLHLPTDVATIVIVATIKDGRMKQQHLSDLGNAKIIVRSQDKEKQVEEISLDLTNTGGLNTTAEFVKLTPNGNQFAIETLNIFSQDTLSILRSKYRK